MAKKIYDLKLDKIKRLMKAYGISNSALIAETQLSRRTVEDVISGKRKASPSTLHLMEISVNNLRKGII